VTVVCAWVSARANCLPSSAVGIRLAGTATAIAASGAPMRSRIAVPTALIPFSPSSMLIAYPRSRILVSSVSSCFHVWMEDSVRLSSSRLG
jgi:hypothetical protein